MTIFVFGHRLPVCLPACLPTGHFFLYYAMIDGALFSLENMAWVVCSIMIFFWGETGETCTYVWRYNCTAWWDDTSTKTRVSACGCV